MKNLGIACGVLGLTGVGLGAFGAHALKPALVERGMLSAWETAVHYHLLHAAALLGLIAWAARISEPMQLAWLRRAGWCWVAGVILFAGSLYGLALGGPRLLGPVTPLGGVAFLIGWFAIIMAAARSTPTAEKT